MDYSSIFNDRAKQYVAASTRGPHIRVAEFEAYFDCLSLVDGERFLDAPCGSGQACTYVPEGVDYVGLDPSTDFVRACAMTGAQVVQSSIRSTPFQASHFDVIGSLTGVHHEAERAELYAEWWRLLRPGGRLVLVDVWAGSPVSGFLNGFVDEWNSQGHAGDFLHEQDIVALEAAGFDLLTVDQLRYQWNADSDVDMHEYMVDLFGLDRRPDLSIMQSAWRALGWRAEAHRCLLPWSLAAITGVKAVG